jgi:hypothetical protein
MLGSVVHFRTVNHTLVPVNCANFFIMFNYYELSENPYPSDRP